MSCTSLIEVTAGLDLVAKRKIPVPVWTQTDQLPNALLAELYLIVIYCSCFLKHEALILVSKTPSSIITGMTTLYDFIVIILILTLHGLGNATLRVIGASKGGCTCLPTLNL
jgi:hypothetical protein